MSRGEPDPVAVRLCSTSTLAADLRDGCALVEITRGKCSALYWVAHTDGQLWAVRHLTSDGGQEYHVLLRPESGVCECQGWLRWQHCKHITAARELAALLAAEQAREVLPDRELVQPEEELP